MAPTMPPAIGATQNSQSWLSAQPPTNSAGPVLRAGFTEVFVTGMETRWISVRPSPMASGANPAGALPWVEPMMMNRNTAVMTNSMSESSAKPVLAGRMLRVAVGGKSLRDVEAGRAARDRVEHRGRHDRADHLRDHVRHDLTGWKPTAGCKPDRDGRIEVAAGDVPDRVGHRHDCQSERQRHAEKSDADRREPGGDDGGAAPAKVSQNVPISSAAYLRALSILSSPSVISRWNFIRFRVPVPDDAFAGRQA